MTSRILTIRPVHATRNTRSSYSLNKHAGYIIVGIPLHIVYYNNIIPDLMHLTAIYYDKYNITSINADQTMAVTSRKRLHSPPK